MEGKQDETLQDRMKFIRKEKRKRTASNSAKGETDIFWNKKNNPKNNKLGDDEE
jgi:hypothetical protein